ncbi:MAG: type II toxin-antitoxin system VapC family toxin [Chloroflexota bacterium]|nr:type II toxin-antitoxin system VapC family toxin [Chloroflexota bacterium]
MIFLDANYFLRFLTEPETPADARMQEWAAALFSQIERGEEQATTSEAVLAEVAFALASKRHYHRSPVDAAAYLTSIILLTNLKLARGQKRRLVRALEIWSDRPNLGFVDALTVATVENTDMTLATFDADFDRIPGVSVLALDDRQL